MAHPVVSFRFADTQPISFSIEARKVIGQEFSSLASLYRQAQLIYVVADERDSIRVRAVYRPGEDVYLYRTVATPQQEQERFLEYLHTLNQLHAKPRWYNDRPSRPTAPPRFEINVPLPSASLGIGASSLMARLMKCFINITSLPPTICLSQS